MTPEELRERYIALKKEVQEARQFNTIGQIRRYMSIQIEKYKVYEAYKRALLNEPDPNHASDSTKK